MDYRNSDVVTNSLVYLIYMWFETYIYGVIRLLVIVEVASFVRKDDRVIPFSSRFGV